MNDQLDWYDINGHPVFSNSHEEAATEWAEVYDYGGFSIATGNSERIKVTNTRTGESLMVKVYGEISASYSAFIDES